MCGVPLRIAPAPGRSSYVELAAESEPGVRATLLGEDRLTAAADNITTGEPWPALILRRTGDRYGFTLLRRGKKLADHNWDPAAPVPDHAAVTATADALAEAYGVTDTRPLTNLLRGSDAPARRQSALVAALGLPRSPRASAPATRSSPPSPTPRSWPAAASWQASWTPSPATPRAARRSHAAAAGGPCASRRCCCSPR